MLIRDIRKTPYFRARDNCLLCELLHPEQLDEPVRFRYSVVHALVRPGEKTIPHMLVESTEVYFVIAGEGRMHIGDESSRLCSGQAVYIPPGAVQYIENTGSTDLVFLAIVDPVWRETDEIILDP
jgi:cytosine deaminase